MDKYDLHYYCGNKTKTEKFGAAQLQRQQKQLYYSRESQ